MNETPSKPFWSPTTVRDLRDKSGAGLIDCREALEACNGSVRGALVWLRMKGLAVVCKERDDAEGHLIFG